MPLTSPHLLTPFLTSVGDGPGGIAPLRDAYVAIDGQDVSTLAHSLSVEETREPVDITRYGTTHREYASSIGEAVFTLDLWTDLQVALPLSLRRGDGILVQTAAHRGAPAPGNPLFSATCIVTRYTALTGAAGDGAGASLEFKADGPVLVAES
jgi:hypothetical protein